MEDVRVNVGSDMDVEVDELDIESGPSVSAKFILHSTILLTERFTLLLQAKLTPTESSSVLLHLVL